MTAWKASSQNTIQISLYQANEAILNAKKVLTLNEKIAELEDKIENQNDQIVFLQLENSIDQKKYLKLQENYNILETQYEAEKAIKPKSKWWEYVLIGLASFATGFMVGSF